MKNTVRRLLAVAMAALMVFSLSGAVFALEGQETIAHPIQAKDTSVSYDLSGMRNGNTFAITDEKADDEIAADQIVTIMVQLKEAPAMEVYSSYKDAKSYAASLSEKQINAVKSINSALGFEIEVSRYYNLLFNGFSFRGEYRLVEELNRLEGVTAFVAAEWEAPVINLYSSGDMVGVIDAWDLDYTGSGRVVAIVDTGLMVDHPAFSTMPEDPFFDQSDIAAILAQGQLHANGSASNVYYNAKVPFRWNYYSNTYNVAHVYNDHGTHVAGIAAGNGGDIVGIAKDAQIAAMQVFANSGGAGWGEILAALEDCVILGVDAANLSLGSPCGFTHYYSPSYAQTFQNLVNAGVNLAMSAGNEYSTALGNAWGGGGSNIGYCLVTDPDYGVTGSPSTWHESLGVASVDNTKSNSYYLENTLTDEQFAYAETDYDQPKLAATFGGQEVEYVYVPGVGNEEDFDGIDVTGKLALIQRGDISFYVKVLNAQAAGACGVLIFNNQSGMINMDLSSAQGLMTIPAVSIPMTSGETLAEVGTGTVYVSNEMALIEAPGGGLPSDFSSWGTTSDLTIKPEIAAPGGNIYSSTDPRPNMSGAYYQVWSGTSMSAPHVAGGMAIVSEYVDDMFPDASVAERQNLVDCILMSTANPVVDSGGELASVRKQGAGLMDLAGATRTTAYLTVPGCERPKLELGDDPDLTGVYEMTFTVNNFGDEELAWAVIPHVLIDDLTAVDVDLNGDYVIAYTQTSWEITDYCDLENPEVVTVPAHGTKDITVKVTLTEDIIEYIDEYYTVGCFVEGFIELIGTAGSIGDVNGDNIITMDDALLAMRAALELVVLEDPASADVNGDGNVTLVDALLILRYAMGIHQGFSAGDLTPGEDLSIPFLAYYGDWNYVPMFDIGFYYDDYSYGSNPNGDNLIGSAFGASVYGLGINPYVATEDYGYYDADRNAISPNDDGFLDSASFMRISLMRNAAEGGVELYNAQGTLLDTLSHSTDIRKAYYSTSSETYSTFEGVSMPNWNAIQYGGQDLCIRVYAYLDNDGRTTTEAFTAETPNMFNEWLIPVHVDIEAPTAEFVSFANGTLTVKLHDEHYVAVACAIEGEIVDGEFTVASYGDEVGLFEESRGVESTVELDGVSDGTFVGIADYAGNEVLYVYNNNTLTEVGESWSHASVSVPEVNMYAYGKNLNTQTWIRFSTGDLDSLYYGGGINSDDGDYTAGTYTGEYVYAVDANNGLVRYDASDINGWTNKTTVCTLQPDYTIHEMAYNKAAGKLYIVEGVGILHEINPQTGAFITSVEPEYGIVAMDFDINGNCYIVDAAGYLCSFDPETGLETGDIAYMGINPINGTNFFPQGGTYANGFFYWFAAPGNAEYYSDMHLLAIEVASGNYTDLGPVYGGLYCIGMFADSIEIPDSTVNHEDFYDNFEGSFNWETVDSDGDGLIWGVEYFSVGNYQDGPRAAVSYSYTQDAGAFEPDNWMISEEFTVGDNRFLSFFTTTANYSATADIAEHYAVYVLLEGQTIENATNIFETTMDNYKLVEHVLDLSAYAGQNIRLAFRHFNCYDQYTLIIDSIAVGTAK